MTAVGTHPAAAQDSTAAPVAVLTAAPDVHLRLGGYVQAESRTFVGDVANRYTNEFLLRRARLDLTGTVANHFDLRFLPDFGQGTVSVQDAWVNVHYVDPLQLQVGKFKVPFGLEQVQHDYYLPLVERSLASDLTPVRDVGAAIHGESIGGILSYAAGIFNGAADGVTGDRGVGNARDVAGRVLVRPFGNSGIPALTNVALGGAGTVGRKDGSTATPDLPTYKSAGQQSAFFSYASSGLTKLDSSVAAGAASRAAVHGYWYLWRLGLFSEYIVSWQKVQRDSIAGTVRNEGANGTVTFDLTPDHERYDGLRPTQPFDPAHGHWGALEAVGQFSTLHIGPTAFRDGFADPTKSARAANAWAYGLNWFLDRHVRLQVDYARTLFVGGAPAGGRRPPENAVLAEVQALF